jgi:hypothetical protein
MKSDSALSTLHVRGATTANRTRTVIHAPSVRTVGQVVKAFFSWGSKPSVKRLASQPDKLLKIQKFAARPVPDALAWASKYDAQTASVTTSQLASVAYADMPR